MRGFAILIPSPPKTARARSQIGDASMPPPNMSGAGLPKDQMRSFQRSISS
jgi:hypothetical protein